MHKTDSRGLNIELFDNAAAISRAAAARIVSALRTTPDLLLCASAGGTPTGTYQRLAAIRAKQPELFRRIRIVQIDEWGGLDAESPATCAADLKHKLLDPLRIPAKRFFGFRADAADPQRECERMAKWLGANGPIGLCILGLGLNGHIAMNEPGASLAPQVHLAKLTASSRQHPMLRGLKRKPAFGLTLGMRDILRSREILLLVSGRPKQKVMNRLVNSGVTTSLPASLLWLHGNARVLCDRDAAGGMET